MTNTQQLLTTQFPDLHWQWDKVLAPLTYFKIGGPAEAYLELEAPEKMVEVAAYCQAQKIPVTILGGASNVIVNDEGIKGVTLHLINQNFQVLDQTTPTQTLVQIGAGTKTALAVSQTVQQGLTGLEYFLGVPGTLGGATYNNAHYLSHLIGNYINRVEVITSDFKLKWLPVAECDFSYDHSRFQTSHEIITQVIFQLQPGELAQSQALIKEATVYRAQTQPLGEPSSGCIFQNAPNSPELKKIFPEFAQQNFVPGGFLIDQAGLKGAQVGDIEVSHKHAAFFVNKGQGTAAQVRELVTKVKSSVQAKFGVELREEVFYLG